MSDKELEEILNEFSTNRERTHTEPKVEAPVIGEPKPENELKFEPAEVLSFENFVEAPKPSIHAEEDEAQDDDDKKGGKPPKKVIIAIVAVVVAIAVGIAVFAMTRNKENPEQPKQSITQETTTEAPVIETAKNPFTGEAEYNEVAVGKRPVAVVVENEYSTEAVRPQWALADADIVLEGESEFSTRLLLFWADYTKVPSKVGPARSARPPFIHFSQLFDSIFIHAGLSKSKGNYVGANTVFTNENIDHVNLLAESSTFFDRDNSRHTAIEHTGYLKGENVPDLISKKGFRTEAKESKFTSLSFYDEETKLSDTVANKVEFRWTTKGNCPKKGHYYYDSTSKTYKTTDFDSKYGESGASWKNLVFLLDQTQYVVKENYKGKGSSETYCDYKLSGGKGAVLSEGTYVDITWGVTNGKLWMKDASGKEIKLNVGKTYIGYGSENYGGTITIVEE